MTLDVIVRVGVTIAGISAAAALLPRLAKGLRSGRRVRQGVYGGRPW